MVVITLAVSAVPVVVGLKSDLILILLSVSVKCNGLSDVDKLVDDITFAMSVMSTVPPVVGLKSDLILILLSVLVKCNGLNDGNKLVDDISLVMSAVPAMG